MSNYKLSIVLPCYNEAENIPNILKRFDECLPSNYSVELILVNNGSFDNSAWVLQRELSKPEYAAFARTVLVKKNQGYGHGIWFGLQQAQGEYLAWSHADMQCDPADIYKAFDKLLSLPHPQKTIIKGLRLRRHFSKELLTVGMQTLAQLILWQPLRDINGQPKVFHHSLLTSLVNPPKDLSFDLYVLYKALKAGWNVETVPVVFGNRLHGESKWAFNISSRYRHILKAIQYMLYLRFTGK